jgi:hypothetical protein
MARLLRAFVLGLLVIGYELLAVGDSVRLHLALPFVIWWALHHGAFASCIRAWVIGYML